MKIVRLIASEDCPNGIDCAKLYELDNGDVLVRGYRITPDLRAQIGDMPADEDAVVLPRAVYEEARKC